jgi:mono/diheme cytochrome c family protein
MRFLSIGRLRYFVAAVAAVIAAVVFFGAGRPAADAVSLAAQRGGADVYARNCARCHGADGRAQTPKGRQVDAVDFTSDEWLPNTARDTRIVTNGKGSMPSFKRKLSAAEISSVVAYIRRFKN